MKDEDITPKVLLEHMQNMQRVLMERMDGLDQYMGGLDQKIDNAEKKLIYRIDKLEINLTQQIDGIDQRLDTIEIEKLPQRVTALEALAHP